MGVGNDKDDNEYDEENDEQNDDDDDGFLGRIKDWVGLDGWKVVKSQLFSKSKDQISW